MPGIHHITAIAGDAARNVDFYTRVLGLRLVKKTVNYDDPGAYHLYFADESGQPGTVLTFFAWGHAAPGRAGVGQAQRIAFRVPAAAIGYWAHRLVEKSVTHGAIENRFGQSVLPFNDPDGTSLSLVGVIGANEEPFWPGDGVGAEHAIRGFHGVTLLVDDTARTAAVLTDVLSFARIGAEASVTRYQTTASEVGGIVDLHEAEGFLSGRMGRGSVHHVAFRAGTDDDQSQMARKLEEQHGIKATEQKNRHYFRSIYFREPGGVLFEIATDGPGFAIDEPVAALGQALRLPPFLESRRNEIEAALSPL